MADFDFYQEDCEDIQDDGDDLALDSDGSNPDEGLTPLQRLEKYRNSENIFSRQMVARSILETLRVIGENEEEDADMVLQLMVKVADDPEPTVRAELMEQIPHLAVYCHENLDLFKSPVPTYILPTVVKYLTDMNNQVRKTSQAALLVLLEQDLVDKTDVEKQVCPVILDLSSPDSIDDFRTEAVALMSKMAPLIGKDITTRLFLTRFCEMCSDSLFHVRKVCAANFGEMCSVVGQEHTEKNLLSRFECLCEDGVWGVRKACAECFMAVSCSCSIDVRRNELAHLFISLICDQSRWVRMSAYQALGGFISTFADPGVTGLYFDEDGILVAGNPDDFPKDGSSEYTEEIPITDGDTEPSPRPTSETSGDAPEPSQEQSQDEAMDLSEDVDPPFSL